MMGLTVRGSLEQAYDLVDNRLVLELAARKIGRGRLPRFFLKRQAILRSIDGTLHYVERQPARAADAGRYADLGEEAEGFR